jgi:hypothetical protein
MAIVTNARRAPDGTVALMFGNCTLSTTPIEFDCTIDPAEYGFPAGSKVSLSRRTPDTLEPMQDLTAPITSRMKLSSADVNVLILSPR